MISSLSAIFALMVAFSASGIWNDALQARAAVQREANAIENVTALASHYPEELRDEVHIAMLRYGRRVIENDWPAMQHRAGVNDIALSARQRPDRPTDRSDRGRARRVTDAPVIPICW